MNRPITLTLLMYRSFLSYAQTKQYSRHLVDNGLVAVVSTISENKRASMISFQLTEKGYEFMRYYEEMVNLTSGMELAAGTEVDTFHPMIKDKDKVTNVVARPPQVTNVTVEDTNVTKVTNVVKAKVTNVTKVTNVVKPIPAPTTTTTTTNPDHGLPLLLPLVKHIHQLESVKKKQRKYPNRDLLQLRVRGLLENDPKMGRKAIAKILDIPEGTAHHLIRSIKYGQRERRITGEGKSLTLNQTPIIK